MVQVSYHSNLLNVVPHIKVRHPDFGRGTFCQGTVDEGGHFSGYVGYHFHKFSQHQGGVGWAGVGYGTTHTVWKFHSIREGVGQGGVGYSS